MLYSLFFVSYIIYCTIIAEVQKIQVSKNTYFYCYGENSSYGNMQSAFLDLFGLKPEFLG